MVELVPMSAERCARWRSQLWPQYFTELVQAGFSPEVARAHCEADELATMPGGQLADGHFAFAVVHEGRDVGNVWLVTTTPGEWSIYDIEIDESVRGTGLGRATMRAIEAHVVERGGSTIGLHVFGFNAPARRLYESEGYETVRVQMRKRLSPDSTPPE